MKDNVTLLMRIAMCATALSIFVMVCHACIKAEKYDEMVDDIAFARCLHVDLSNYTTGYGYDEEQKMWIFTAENEYKKITVGYKNKETLKAVVTNTYCK